MRIFVKKIENRLLACSDDHLNLLRSQRAIVTRPVSHGFQSAHCVYPGPSAETGKSDPQQREKVLPNTIMNTKSTSVTEGETLQVRHQFDNIGSSVECDIRSIFKGLDTTRVIHTPLKTLRKRLPPTHRVYRHGYRKRGAG